MEVFKLADYMTFRDDAVGRNLVLQTEKCTTIVLNLRPGQYIPAHSHPGRHVQLHMRKGELHISCGGPFQPIPQDGFVWVHGDEQLSIRNDSNSDASVLVMLHA